MEERKQSFNFMRYLNIVATKFKNYPFPFRPKTKSVLLQGKGILTRKVVTVAMELALWIAPSLMQPSGRLGPANCGILKRIQNIKRKRKRNVL